MHLNNSVRRRRQIGMRKDTQVCLRTIHQFMIDKFCANILNACILYTDWAGWIRTFAEEVEIMCVRLVSLRNGIIISHFVLASNLNRQRWLRVCTERTTTRSSRLTLFADTKAAVIGQCHENWNKHNSCTPNRSIQSVRFTSIALYANEIETCKCWKRKNRENFGICNELLNT